VTKVTAGNMSNCRFGRIVTMTLVQTAWWGWCLAMVSGPEGVVAQLGGPAVMIRGGSRRVWCHIVRRRLGWVQMRCRESRRRLPSRLGCAPGAGLRLLGSRRWWRTRWWRTRWSPRSATPRGRLYLPGWPSRRYRSRMCRVRAISGAVDVRQQAVSGAMAHVDGGSDPAWGVAAAGTEQDLVRRLRDHLACGSAAGAAEP
jgi:hypothetical protein